MKFETIKALNQLNTTFYEQIAQDFNVTRQHFWPGWSHLMTFTQPLLPSSPHILDVGCGNGRFASFIAPYFSEAHYVGLDNNHHLLTVAQNLSLPPTFRAQWQHWDLVTSLLENSQLPPYLNSHFNLSVLFGVMHHIPSFDLRKQLLATLLNQTEDQGILVFTVWRFLDTERLAHKRVDFAQLGIDTQDLEPHDYLLDWKKGQIAYRYCHYIDDDELTLLLQDLPVRQSARFADDAKEGNVNLYMVLQKTT